MSIDAENRFPNQNGDQENENPGSGAFPPASNSSPLDSTGWPEDPIKARREGLWFGLMGTEIKEKLKVIEALFAHKIETARRKKEEDQEKEDRKATLVDELGKEVVQIQDQIKELTTRQPEQPSFVFRRILGLVFFALMPIAPFLLTSKWLVYSFEGLTPLMAGSLVAFGMFSLYFLQSWFFKAEKTVDRPLWKVLLEELGAPVLTASLVVSFAIGQVGWHILIPAFLFLTLVFLLAGRGMLSLVTSFNQDWQTMRNNRKEGRLNRQRRLKLEKALEDLEPKLDQERENLRTLQQLVSNHDDEQALRAKAEYIKEEFLAEYHFGRQLAQKLSAKELEGLKASYSTGDENEDEDGAAVSEETERKPTDPNSTATKSLGTIDPEKEFV